MGFLDFLFGKKKTAPEVKEASASLRGDVKYSFDRLDAKNVEKVRECYIAFDLETTGFTPGASRAIEIAAVRFENGVPVKSYSSLIKSTAHVPSEASRVNHITDDMLKTQGRNPSDVYREFAEFIGDAMNGVIPLVAHNAPFDCSFLQYEMGRVGISANLRCFDTLKISRQLVRGLDSYKQPDLAEHFHIELKEEHRACADAEVCGRLLWELTNIECRQIVEIAAQAEKYKLTDRMMAYCGCIANSLLPKIKKRNRLQFSRDLSGYVSINCIGYNVCKFKFTAKSGSYIIVDKKKAPKEGFVIDKCSSSEGEDCVRVFFRLPEHAEWVTDYIAEEFEKQSKYWDDLIKYGEGTEDELPLYHIIIKEDEFPGLIKNLVAMNEAEAAELKEKEEAENLKEEERRKKEEKKAERQAQEKKRQEEIDAIRAAGERLATDKRQVIQMDDEENLIAEFESVTAAAEAAGVTTKSIRDACSGRQKHAAGSVWRYKDEV